MDARVAGAVLLGLVLALSLLAGCDSSAAATPAAFAVEWGYSGAGGPDHWARLSEENAACAKGQQQSPIDIAGYETADSERMAFSYGVADAPAMRNDGRQVHVVHAKGNTLSIGQQTFTLKSAHFHTPSEHLIDGVSFVAELHLVHANTDGDLAVVGVLFTAGETNPAAQAVLDADPATGNTATPATLVDPGDYAPEGLSYYHYPGSKTTPPCAEPVSWYVMREPRTISGEQVRNLQALSGGPNNRPIQPLGDRVIVVTEAPDVDP